MRNAGVKAVFADLAAAALWGCGGSREALHVFTWADYIDPELLATFERAHHCRVVVDTFDSNEVMFAKLKAGARGYDIVMPSSYMAAVMQREGMLAPIDHAKVPNLAHIDPVYLRDLAIDKEMRYSVPYMLSNTGIAYRKSRVKDFQASWAMFDRADLAGRMTLLNDMRETLGGALKSIGCSLNTTNEAEIEKAKDVVLRWKKNIAKFESEQYKPGIASGEFLVVHGYNGDLLQVMGEEKDVGYAVPREGTSVACDDMVILKESPRAELAHAFINFLHEPPNAARNTETVEFLCPNAAAYPLLSEEVRSNPTVFLAEELRRKCEVIRDLGADNAKYTRAWDEIKAK
jgi:spermidine/putrescine transport system substrate-binding protein